MDRSHWGAGAGASGEVPWALEVVGGPGLPLLLAPTLAPPLSPSTLLSFWSPLLQETRSPDRKLKYFSFQKPSEFSLFLAVSRPNWGHKKR